MEIRGWQPLLLVLLLLLSSSAPSLSWRSPSLSGETEGKAEGEKEASPSSLLSWSLSLLLSFGLLAEGANSSDGVLSLRSSWKETQR